MKLFMEINPTLFDECTNEYTAIQEAAPQRLAERENVWKILEEQAALKRKSLDEAKISKAATQSEVRAGSPMEGVTEDPATSHSQKKLDELHIEDESHKKVVS